MAGELLNVLQKAVAMTISLSNAGKRFNRDWIFRRVTHTFNSGSRTAITGSNGSGKSTLLQVIAGAMQLNEGQLALVNNAGQSILTDSVFRHISICAPYLELVEEMSLIEFLTFHSTFKPFINSLTANDIPAMVQLQGAENKAIRNYSSGMKQRVKLAQAILTDVPVILLDEPCTNLDQAGIELYKNLIATYAHDRTIIVSSNDPVEYSYCESSISMASYK